MVRDSTEDALNLDTGLGSFKPRNSTRIKDIVQRRKY
jgi:hypothetical protein